LDQCTVLEYTVLEYTVLEYTLLEYTVLEYTFVSTYLELINFNKQFVFGADVSNMFMIRTLDGNLCVLGQHFHKID